MPRQQRSSVKKGIAAVIGRLAGGALSLLLWSGAALADEGADTAAPDNGDRRGQQFEPIRPAGPDARDTWPALHKLTPSERRLYPGRDGARRLHRDFNTEANGVLDCNEAAFDVGLRKNSGAVYTNTDNVIDRDEYISFHLSRLSRDD